MKHAESTVKATKATVLSVTQDSLLDALWLVGATIKLCKYSLIVRLDSARRAINKAISENYGFANGDLSFAGRAARFKPNVSPLYLLGSAYL